MPSLPVPGSAPTGDADQVPTQTPAETGAAEGREGPGPVSEVRSLGPVSAATAT